MYSTNPRVSKAVLNPKTLDLLVWPGLNFGPKRGPTCFLYAESTVWDSLNAISSTSYMMVFHINPNYMKEEKLEEVKGRELHTYD